MVTRGTDFDRVSTSGKILKNLTQILLALALAPNPSVNRTRYGRRRKAGAQRLRHCRAPALHRPPPRAGYLER
jgi:hypothetical protein